LLALLLAACGGSSALTKSQLASKVNAACATLASAAQAAGTSPSDFNTNAVSAAAYLDKGKAAGDAFRASIDKLVPPDSEKATWNTFKTAVDKADTLLDTADRKAHNKDPSGLADYNQSQAEGNQIKAGAAQLGVTTCV
jgi:hypothetical protein